MEDILRVEHDGKFIPISQVIDKGNRPIKVCELIERLKLLPPLSDVLISVQGAYYMPIAIKSLDFDGHCARFLVCEDSLKKFVLENRSFLYEDK